MMKNNPLIILSAVLALLASCTPRQADDEITATATPVPLQIESVVLQGSGNGTTRADATTPVPVTEGEIGVFCKRSSSGGSLDGDQLNIGYTCNGGKWEPTIATEMIQLNWQPDEIYAYYPRRDLIEPGHGFGIILYPGPLDETPGAPYNPNNTCYAEGRSVNSQVPTTTFEMKHAMALLRFHLKRAKDETTYIGFSELKMEALTEVPFALNGVLDLTGKYELFRSSEIRLMYFDFDPLLVVPADGSEVTWAYMVVPCDELKNTLDVIFTLADASGKPLTNESTVSATIDFSAFGNKWEAGKVYDISFTVKLGELKLNGTGVTITDWTNVYVGSGDYPATPGPIIPATP